MTLLSRLLDRGEVRSWEAFEAESARIPSNSEVGVLADSGPSVSERAALQTIDVYACTSLLADSISMLPLDALRRGDESRIPVTPTPSLIAQPDPDVERFDHINRMVMSLAMRGMSYNAVLERDALQRPQSVRALHPDDIQCYKNAAGRRAFKDRSGRPIPTEDVMAVPLVLLPGEVVGLSPLACARRGIRLAIQTELFGDRWFNDGAAPSSVLETDEPLDDAQAKIQQARWIASHRGRRRPAVLSHGFKWRPITITPNESQFLESRQLNTSQIARMWRVPPHMIGDVERTTSWGSGIEEQGIGFVVFTLGPYLARLEAAFSRAIPGQQYARFNVGALLRGAQKDRYASYAVGRQWGWLSVNDIRALEDLPPIPEGGDIYLQPLNMVEASAALALMLKNQNEPGGGGDG